MFLDGSYGEGGGQLLRTALGFSTLFSTPVTIGNIRAKRPNPGLRPQHLAVVRLFQRIAEAKVLGDEESSQCIEFTPLSLHGGRYSFDIGTAGSIPLLMHSVLLPLSFAEIESTVNVTGGTDVSWSPTIDFFTHVTLPALSKIGICTACSLGRRGYYPRGGGSATLEVSPIKKIRPLNDIRFEDPDTLHICSTCAGLPESVARTQAEAACMELSGYDVDVHVDCSGYGIGSSITIWTQAGDLPIGACVVGRKGYCASSVGSDAAKMIMDAIGAHKVENHLSDQLAPFLCLCDGESSIPVESVSGHLSTVLDIASRIIGATWRQENNSVIITGALHK